MGIDTFPRKNFIPRNDSFTCQVCSYFVDSAQGTFRNHCSHCLTSKHVDSVIPGDRASVCHGLMIPVEIEGTNPDDLVIIHECERCGKVSRNTIARDDNRRTLFNMIRKQAGGHTPV